MSTAQEALDYLVSMARGHDYADAAKIAEALWVIEDALSASPGQNSTENGSDVTRPTS